MTKGKIRNVALGLAMGVLLLGVGFGWGKRSVSGEKGNLDLGLMWQVKGALEEDYLDKEKLIDEEMVWGSIKGLVSSLGDPYTMFLAPRENEVSEENLAGEFGGVGISLGFKEKTLAIISPLVETPAAKAGLQAGDLILRIKDGAKEIDRDTTGISLSEAVQLIRGPVGTVVTLEIYREGEDKPFEVDLKRDKIVVPSIELEWIEDETIAWIKLYKFSESLYDDWQDVVKEISLRKNKGIILDLRDNPGGYLQASVVVASDFLKSGVVVKQDNSNGKMDVYRVDERKGGLVDEPLVVLINGGSASASEILAGALREHSRAKLVGEMTFGKGTVQAPKEFRDGSGLHVTVARWLLPSGESIDGKGVEPDVKVEYDSTTEEDEQLTAAVKELLNY